MSSPYSYQSAQGARTSSDHSSTTWGKPTSQSHLTPQQLSQEVQLLRSKQHQLKSRLTMLLIQQLQESFGQYPQLSSTLSLPTSLDMIIFGLREELERVGELLLSLQQEIILPPHSDK